MGEIVLTEKYDVIGVTALCIDTKNKFLLAEFAIAVYTLFIYERSLRARGGLYIESNPHPIVISKYSIEHNHCNLHPAQATLEENND